MTSLDGKEMQTAAGAQKATIEITSQQLLLIMEGIPLLSKKRVRYEHHFVGNLPMKNAESMRA